MGHGRTPAPPRGRPGGKPRDGDRHLQSGRRRARGPRNPRSEPRSPKGKRRVKRRLLCRRRKGPLRWPWRWRSRGRTTLFSPFFSFLLCYDFCFLFSLVRRFMGGRSTGIPHYNRASWFGVGKGFLIKSPPLPRKGQWLCRCHGPPGRM